MWKHLKPMLFSRTLLLILLRRHNYNVFFVHENVFIAFLTNQNCHWTNSRGGDTRPCYWYLPTPPSYPPSPPPQNHQATTREKFPAVTFYKYQMEGQLRIRGVVFDRVSHQIQPSITAQCNLVDWQSKQTDCQRLWLKSCTPFVWKMVYKWTFLLGPII